MAPTFSFFLSRAHRVEDKIALSLLLLSSSRLYHRRKKRAIQRKIHCDDDITRVARCSVCPRRVHDTLTIVSITREGRWRTREKQRQNAGSDRRPCYYVPALAYISVGYFDAANFRRNNPAFTDGKHTRETVSSSLSLYPFIASIRTYVPAFSSPRDERRSSSLPLPRVTTRSR